MLSQSQARAPRRKGGNKARLGWGGGTWTEDPAPGRRSPGLLPSCPRRCSSQADGVPLGTSTQTHVKTVDRLRTQDRDRGNKNIEPREPPEKTFGVKARPAVGGGRILPSSLTCDLFPQTHESQVAALRGAGRCRVGARRWSLMAGFQPSSAGTIHVTLSKARACLVPRFPHMIKTPLFT